MLAGERVPTRRTAPPVPRTAAGEVPQGLEKRFAALDNVHGPCHLGRFSTSYGGSGPLPPPSPHQHGLGTESRGFPRGGVLDSNVRERNRPLRRAQSAGGGGVTPGMVVQKAEEVLHRRGLGSTFG